MRRLTLHTTIRDAAFPRTQVLHAAWSDGPAAMKAEMEREGFLIPLSFLMMIVYLVCQVTPPPAQCPPAPPVALPA